MPIIKVKLKDKDSCKGCYCLEFLGLLKGHWCKHFNIIPKYQVISWLKGKVIRPQHCKDELGT